MLPDICSDMGTTRKICMGEEIQKSGIIPVTSVKVTEIGDNVVIGEKDGEKVEFPCDAAVLAIGAKKRDGSALAETCYKNGIGYFEIGDAAMQPEKQWMQHLHLTVKMCTEMYQNRKNLFS